MTATANFLTNVEFEGRVVARTTDPDYDEIYDDNDRLQPPYYPDSVMRPEIGMRVHVFYDTSAEKTCIHCLPLRVPNPDQELSLPVRRATCRIDGIDRPSDVIGEGVITAVRYKPGRSGKFYPYVSVEIQGN